MLALLSTRERHIFSKLNRSVPLRGFGAGPGRFLIQKCGKMNIKRIVKVGALRKCAAALAAACALSPLAFAQTAVLGNFSQVLVYPLISFPAGSCPATVTVNTVTGGAGSSHGVGFYGSDFALVSYFSQSQIRNVQLSTGTVLNTISTSGIGYNGTSTIAVAPNLQYAVAASGGTAFIFQAPFTAPVATSVALPGAVAGYQTQAIAFNAASRAFISHSGGVSVMDPPYTSVAFTIPGDFEAIAISPDGNTLLLTNLNSNVSIITGPFSAGSTPVVLSIPAAGSMDGIQITPDGTRALVTTGIGPSDQIHSIAAPFTASSVVERIALPAGLGTFEDITISADGLYALMTGNSGASMGLVRAPFTTAGATACALPVAGGRGAGAVRFLPTGLQPPPGPPPRPPADIPTISEWVMIGMAMLAAMVGMLGLRRRQRR